MLSDLLGHAQDHQQGIRQGATSHVDSGMCGSAGKYYNVLCVAWGRIAFARAHVLEMWGRVPNRQLEQAHLVLLLDAVLGLGLPGFQ